VLVLDDAIGVGQAVISPLEQRCDTLLSTLKRHVDALGRKFDLVAKFPNRPPVIIEQFTEPSGPTEAGRQRATRQQTTRRRSRL